MNFTFVWIPARNGNHFNVRSSLNDTIWNNCSSATVKILPQYCPVIAIVYRHKIRQNSFAPFGVYEVFVVQYSQCKSNLLVTDSIVPENGI